MKKRIFAIMLLFVMGLTVVPSLIMAQGVAGDLAPYTGNMPQAEIGTGTIKTLFQSIISYLWIIILGIAVIMMLVGAIMWMTSGGDATKTKTARMLIIYALMGFAVALVARTALEWVVKLLIP